MVEELLLRTHHAPGTSMLALVEQLGYRVIEHDLPDAVEAFAVRDTRTIVHHPTGYLARDQFTLAHELMEFMLPESLRALPRKEELCDRGAAALLLPATAFRASVRRFGLDLAALRKHWRLASWSSIARRLVDVQEATTVANWESLELRWRYGGEAHPDEEHALAEVYAGRGRARVGKVRAWRLGGAGLGHAVSVTS